MPAINDNQFIIDNVLTANEFVFHALDCDKENAHLNVIGRLAISSRGSELVNKITNRIEIKNSGEEGLACAYLLGQKYSPAGKIVTQETAKFSLPTYMKVLDEILLNEELPFPKNILDSIVTYWKYTKLSWLSFFAIIAITLIPLFYLLAYLKHNDLPQHPMFGIYIVFAISLSAFVLLLWCKKQMNSYWNLKESKKTFTCECDRKTIQALIVSTAKQKDSWSLAAREVIEIATKGVESLPCGGDFLQMQQKLLANDEVIAQKEKMLTEKSKALADLQKEKEELEEKLATAEQNLKKFKADLKGAQKKLHTLSKELTPAVHKTLAMYHFRLKIMENNERKKKNMSLKTDLDIIDENKQILNVAHENGRLLKAPEMIEAESIRSNFLSADKNIYARDGLTEKNVEWAMRELNLI